MVSEMPIISVAASMEYWGVGFDFSKQESIPALIEAKLAELNEGKLCFLFVISC
jgi:hypothetical protein